MSFNRSMLSSTSVFALTGALMLAATGAAQAQTIVATSPTDITTAIADANNAMSPVVVTPSGNPVDLSGTTFNAVHEGVLQFGNMTSLGLIANGALVVGDSATPADVTFELPFESSQTVNTTFSGTGSLTFTTGYSTIAAFDATSGVGEVVTVTGPNTYTGGTNITDPGSSPLIVVFANQNAEPTSGTITLTSAGEPYGTAVAAFGFQFTTSDLHQVSTSSVGTVALGADDAKPLDFTGYQNVSLGAASAVGGQSTVFTYSGTLTPYNSGGTATYLVGGGNDTLEITSNLGDLPGNVTGLNAGYVGTTILNPTVANTYTGLTEVSWGFLEFGSAAALPSGTANLKVDQYAVAAFGLGDGVYNLTQAALNQLTLDSSGAVALTGNSTAALNFTAYPNVSLGAVNGLTTASQPIVYSGVLTPGAKGYMLGGGNTPLVVDTLLSGTNALTVNSSSHNTIPVVLTFVDTYSGATEVNGGTLQFGNADLIGETPADGTINPASAITLKGGSLLFAEPDDQTFSNTITGFALATLGQDGGIQQYGPGKITLTAVEDYGGLTDIDGGTLAIGPAGSIENSRGLAFFPNTTGPLEFDISSAGSQTIQSLLGSPQANLTQNIINLGANTLTIEPAKYQEDSPLGLASPSSFYGIIQGTGGISLQPNNVASDPNSKGFAGELTLVGNSTYSGGTAIGVGTTLQLGDGTYNGTPGTMGVANSGNLVFNEHSAQTFNNIITGNGNLTQDGPGTVTLDAVNTFSGQTEIVAGTLVIGDEQTPTAEIEGNVQVDAMGTLAGIGIIQGNVVNDGTLNNNDPFLNTGLTIRGDYTQGSSAELLIGVTPANVTLLTVTGVATLDGTVTFAYAPGVYAAKTYLFLQSSGLNNTSFETVAASVSQPIPTGFTQAVTYTFDDAFVTLAATTPTPPTPTPPTPTPPTPTPPTPTPPTPTPPTPTPPTPTPPTPTPPTPTPPTPTPPTPTPPTPTPPTPTPPTPTPPPPTPTPPPPTPTPPPIVIGPRDPTIFSAQDVAFAELNQAAIFDLLHRTLPDGGGNTFDNMSQLGGPEGRAWVQAQGSFLDASRDGSTPSLHSNGGGVEGGADAAVGDGGRGRIGVALGYEADSLGDSLGSSASQDIVRVSLYGSEMAGPFILSGALSYAHGWDHVDRASGAGFSYSSRGTDEFTGAVQLSAPVAAEVVIFTPAVGALFSTLRSGSFIEHNSLSPAFAVVGLGSTMSIASPYVTLGLSHAFVGGGGLVVTPDAMVGYRYDDAAGGPRDPLAGGGAIFPDNQIGLDRGGALAGVSLTAHQGSWTGYIKYRATLASGWTDQSVAAGLRIAF